MSELTLALSSCQLPAFLFLLSLSALSDEYSSCIPSLCARLDVTYRRSAPVCCSLPLPVRWSLPCEVGVQQRAPALTRGLQQQVGTEALPLATGLLCGIPREVECAGEPTAHLRTSVTKPQTPARRRKLPEPLLPSPLCFCACLCFGRRNSSSPYSRLGSRQTLLPEFGHLLLCSWFVPESLSTCTHENPLEK